MEARKSKIKVPTALVPSENFHSDLKMTIFWLFPASNGKERLWPFFL